tara:strand:+ start:301 stop:462 length:162 start_codon:yes stop_codon:yes gene_type:complete
MMEPATLYKVQQYYTTGWDDIATKLLKEEASAKLNYLIGQGVNPKELRVRIDS